MLKEIEFDIFLQIGFYGVIGLVDKFNSLNVFFLSFFKLKRIKILCLFWLYLKFNGIFGKVFYKIYLR